MKKLFFTIIGFLFCCNLSFGQQQTVGLFLNDSLAEEGYNLFTVGNDTYLIDNCGLLVNSWTSNYKPGLSVYLLENGDLLRPCRINGNFNGGGIGGRFERFNWEGDLLWSYDYATNDYHQHHDIAPLPNGNFLAIAWDRISPANAIAAGRDPDLTADNGVWPDKIVEIEMIGTNGINIVWEWRAWDHLIQDFDSTKDNFGVVADHPELFDFNFEAYGDIGPINNGSDWLHFNGIDYNPDLDQIALSSRHLSEIYIIDHSTTTLEAAGHTGGNSGMGGDILYRYGNPQAYDRGTVADRKYFKQHDIKWIPAGYPNEGKLSVFNNGLQRPDGTYSTVDLIDPPIDAAGNYIIEANEAFGPTDLFWTYVANPPESFFSVNISGAQFLPNGNVLICDGNRPRFFEVDLDGNRHWDYISPMLSNGTSIGQGSTQNPGDVFRVNRYSLDYPGLEGRDLTPGLPLETNPLDHDCEYYSTTTSINDFTTIGLSFFPNPASDQLTFKWQQDEALSIRVFNLVGQQIKAFRANNGQTTIDIFEWNNGVYMVEVEGYGVAKLIVAK